MRRMLYLFPAAALLIGATQLLPARGEANVDITVTGADGVRQLTTASSLTLEGLLSNVLARVAVNYGDAVKNIVMVPSSALDTSLTKITPRLAYHYADASRSFTFAYPKSLVNDTVPPQILGNVSASGQGTSLLLQWNSNEFTKVTVDFGTQSGVYSQHLEDISFATQHTVTLPNLVPGATYYIKITQTDLSGNQMASAEQTVVLIDKQFAYMPLLKK